MAFKNISNQLSVLLLHNYTFIKIIQKLEMQQNHGNKIKQFDAQLTGKNLQYFDQTAKYFASQILSGQEGSVEELKKVKSQSITKNRTTPRTLLIFVPISVASSGKTTMFNLIASINKDYYSKIVSSDQIRSTIMKRIAQQYPESPQTQIFSKAAIQTNQIFYQNLQKYIVQFAHKQTNPKGIILVDKNHQLTMIKRTVSCINKCRSNLVNAQVKIVALVPKVETFIKATDNSFEYPFSYSYALTSMKRVISRDIHETLSGSEQYRVNVVASFVNCFRNFPIQTSYLLDNYFDVICPVKFNNQAESWTEDIKNLLLKILQESQPQNFSMHSLIPELTKMLKSYDYNDICPKKSVKYALAQIHRIFNYFAEDLNCQNKKKTQLKSNNKDEKLKTMTRAISVKQTFITEISKYKYGQKKML